MDKLLTSSIRTTARLLRKVRLSPVTVTDACLERAQNTTNLNAFITLTPDLARQLAEQSAQRHLAGTPVSDLDGISVAIKDNFCTAHVRTTCASEALANFVPTYNATVYERLLNSGAVLIGKCNMDQFAMGSGTVDGVFGPTKNIWGCKNQEDFHIAGGSSGGCAVAVASGSCYGAIGSDTGGSTRNPASYCGLVGLKPTYGLVSRLGLIPLVNSMDVPGILARTVSDCVSLLNVVAGPDPADPTSLKRSFHQIRLPIAGTANVRCLRVGIPVEYHCAGLNKEILDTWEDTALLLQDNGAHVQQVSLPHTELSIACYSILNQCEVTSNMARYDGIQFGWRSHHEHSTETLYASTRSQAFGQVVRDRILVGNYLLLAKNYEKYFNQALRVRRLISDDFDNVWQHVDVLLTPTTLTPPPLYSEFISKTNHEQCTAQDFCTQPVNMAGVPAVSLPIRLSASGLPLSLQLIGSNLSEARLLAIASHLEHLVQFRRHILKV